MKGCLLAPFKFIGILFQLIKLGIVWCLENGIKGFVAAGVCVILLGVVLGKCNGNGSTVTNTTIPTGTEAPSKIEAPYYATSGTESYFMGKYHWQGNLLIIENYWYLNGEVWIDSGGKAKVLSVKPKVGIR